MFILLLSVAKWYNTTVTQTWPMWALNLLLLYSGQFVVGRSWEKSSESQEVMCLMFLAPLTKHCLEHTEELLGNSAWAAIATMAEQAEKKSSTYVGSFLPTGNARKTKSQDECTVCPMVLGKCSAKKKTTPSTKAAARRLDILSFWGTMSFR